MASENRLVTRFLARLRLRPISPSAVVTIMQRPMLSLAVMLLFLLPLLPSPPSAAPAALSGKQGNSGIQASDSSSDIQPVGDGASTAASEADEPAPVEVPAPPDYQEFTGSPRATVLQWNRTRVFNNRDQSADFAVTGETGMLYHEVNNFSRLSTGRAKIVVENYNPWDPSAPYINWLGVNQPVFMGFRIPPQRVAIDGFWIFVWGPSGGLMNFTIYRAKPGIAPALAQPNLTAPVRWPALQGIIPSIANANGSWVWLDTNETALILDSASTYANTYFFAIWRPAASSKLQPVLVYDTAWPDMVDESDSYIGWTPPVYYQWDFFLNVSIIQYPTFVNMRVNGLPVQDVAGQPARGFWQNWPMPAFNMTSATRLYDVTSSAPVLFFDVAWFGQLYATVTANALCRVWAARPTVDWEVRFDTSFPSTSLGRLIIVSIETDWDVSEVRYNGVPFLHWKEEADYVRIDNALSGSWLILCKAPDYAMGAEVRNFLGEVITEANAADQVTVRGYLHDPLGVNVTTGWGYLLVYDPHDTIIFLDYVPIPLPGGIVDIGWWIWESGTGAGKYVLQVLWANGTEAGMVVTVLTVYSGTYLVVTYEYPSSPSEPIIRGDTVIIEVYYYYDEFQYMYPVDDAIVEVYNDTSGGYWPDYDWYNWASSGYPGYYTAYLYTDFVTPGVLNNVTMRIYADYSEEQSYPKQFSVKTKVTRIVFFWNGNPLPGLTNTSPTDWRTSPEPYLNDSSLQFTIMYTDESGFPLPGAQLSPFIIVNGTNQYKRLNWIDLSDIDSTNAGFYNISIDTNQIGSITLHEGDVCYIIINAYKAGYESTWSSPIWVRPRPRPSYIDVPDQYNNIYLYAGWQYTSALRVVLRDVLTDDDLSHGSLNASIPGLGNVTLDLATPGLGLYEIRDLDTTNIPIGNNTVTIYAAAKDFAPSTVNVYLIIRPKREIDYSIPTGGWVYQELQPNLGTRCSLTIRFFFKPSLPSRMAMYGAGWHAMEHGRQTNDSLPQDAEVTLSVESLTGDVKSAYLKLDASGTASYEHLFDVEGEYHLYVTIAEAEDYAGVDHLRLEMDGIALSASIVSPLSYLTARLPFYALIAALAIVIPLGGYLGYRQAVVLPRKRRRLAKYQSIADTFSDVANLSRLLVLHKESGICVFDPFSEETKDATLVAGFLQAISTFGHDLVESPGLAGKNKEQASTLRELTYEGFRILIHDGQFVRNALVLSGKPSDQLRERLERFTGEFEKRYRKDFDHWSGRVDQFNSASDLVEEIFLVSLRLPHRVQARRPRGVTLSQLEDDLYKLAKELTKDREYLFLGQILSTYLITAKHNKLEALMGIYQLRSKGLLVPWQLDSTMTAASENADNGTQ